MGAFLREFWEGLRIALRAIRANKLRALLTTLGIIIGIVAVTSMFTTINGIERAFDRSMAMIGNDVLYVQERPWFFPPSDWWKYRNRPEIKEEAVDAIRERARYVAAVAPVVQTGRPVQYRDRRITGAFIQGSTPDLTRVENLDLSSGRWYSELETRTARPVCIIGAEVEEKLFPGERALGKTMRVDGHRCEVIGVLVRQGKFLGLFSFDTQVQMPITTFKRLFGGRRSVTIEVKAASQELVDEAEDELIGIMRVVRRLDALEEDNFAVNKQEAFRLQLATFKATVYTAGIFLAGLALLVGGIGVMNIMFVSVRERTKEIGIRKAVGAKRRSIMTQFLLEAIMVCILGGLIGILFSAGVTLIINQVFTAYLSPGIVFIAFSVCVAVGITFGLIPAWSAARAHPIEALRYE